MTPSFYLVFFVVILTISVFLLKRTMRRRSDEGIDWTEEDVSLALKEDDLASGVSARIFNPEDSNFVTAETSRPYARRFREERTALALAWLRRVRSQVNNLTRAHRRAVRRNPDLRPTDELQFFFEFLLFQLTSGILYCVIWVHGPLSAARLVGWSMDLAGKLRKIADDAMPVVASAAVEIIRTDRQVIRPSKT